MGGKHAEGLTANAFLYFRDQSFIELISFTKPALVRLLIRSGLGFLLLANGPQHVRYRFGQTIRFPPGLIDAALLADSLEDLSDRMMAVGIKHIAPQSFGRDTPSGVRLSWQILCPLDCALPFVRDQYRSDTPIPSPPCDHPNRVTGIRMLHYAVDDIAEAANSWTCMGEQLRWEGAAAFTLDGIAITYHATSAHPLWKKWVSSTRAKPVKIDLLGEDDSHVGALQLPAHWHCQIEIVR
jgi:hypothetical protein